MTGDLIDIELRQVMRHDRPLDVIVLQYRKLTVKHYFDGRIDEWSSWQDVPIVEEE